VAKAKEGRGIPSVGNADQRVLWPQSLSALLWGARIKTKALVSLMKGTVWSLSPCGHQHGLKQPGDRKKFPVAQILGLAFGRGWPCLRQPNPQGMALVSHSWWGESSQGGEMGCLLALSMPVLLFFKHCEFFWGLPLTVLFYCHDSHTWRGKFPYHEQRCVEKPFSQKSWSPQLNCTQGLSSHPNTTQGTAPSSQISWGLSPHPNITQ
jgi:hypothetical protein